MIQATVQDPDEPIGQRSQSLVVGLASLTEHVPDALVMGELPA